MSLPELRSSHQFSEINLIKQFSNLNPISIKASESIVSIIWPDLHISEFTVPWLEKYSYKAAKKLAVTPVSWDAKQYNACRETVDYNDFMDGSRSDGYRTVLRQLKDYGLSFIRNAPVTSSNALPMTVLSRVTVESVAEKFGVIRVIDHRRL